MNGILIINKAQGLNSTTVVNRLKYACGKIKTGHTGTLDPNATGVLPVCFGNATKVCGFLTDTSKEYRAEVLFGLDTDSYDILGKVLAEKPSDVTVESLTEVLKNFVGTQMQVPPMFSAIWMNGERLYDLARKGITVEREAREVTINYIDLEDTVIENGFVQKAYLKIGCSKGTYIRSICHDLGEKLGCGACMGDLTRTRVGSFRLEDSITLDEALKLAEEGKLEERLIPADSVYDYPSYTISAPETEHLLVNGNRIRRKAIDPQMKSGLYKLYDSKGTFRAIYELKENASYLYPYIVFPENI